MHYPGTFLKGLNKTKKPPKQPVSRPIFETSTSRMLSVSSTFRLLNLPELSNSGFGKLTPFQFLISEFFIILKMNRIAQPVQRRAGRPGFDSRHGKIFLFSTASRRVLRPTKPPYPMGTGSSFPGGKVAGA
jgi:hypothetical protein